MSGYYIPKAPPSSAKASVNTETAALVAAQLKSQLGNNAAVKATGSTVTIASTYGLGEHDWSSATITLPVTAAHPKITNSEITLKNTQGDHVLLNHSAPAATAKLNQDLTESARSSQKDALSKGASHYQVNLPRQSGIDSVTKCFGSEEDTTGRPKKLRSATLDFSAGTSDKMGEYPYVPVYPVGQ